MMRMHSDPCQNGTSRMADETEMSWNLAASVLTWLPYDKFTFISASLLINLLDRVMFSPPQQSFLLYYMWSINITGLICKPCYSNHGLYFFLNMWIEHSGRATRGIISLAAHDQAWTRLYWKHLKTMQRCDVGVQALYVFFDQPNL